MIALYVWFFFIAGCAINVHWLAGLDLARIDFLDGVLIGQAYYVIVPLAVFLIERRAEVSDLGLVYRPYQDLGTTGVLILGMLLFPALRIAFGRVPRAYPDIGDPRLASLVMVLFVVTGAASFLITGLAHGGHWQENLDSAFDNPLFLPLKYASNVARNAVFAVLLYRVTTGRTTTARALGLGLAFVVFDLLTTFNRITAVYLLILALLLTKHRPVRMVVAGAASLWSLSIVSGVWPVFRGLATAQGYSAGSFAQAWQTARAAQEAGPGTLDASLNAVFESSNIVVLNWIVETYGMFERPFLTYAMFARPITLLLPGSLWAGRPQNFGLSLGNDIAHIPSLALNSTLYGESYANFGWFWPLGLSAFVLLWHGAYRIIAPRSRLVQMMGAFAAIAMWRFDASFVGCAALLTGALVLCLKLVRLSRFKPLGRFYATSATGIASVALLALQLR